MKMRKVLTTMVAVICFVMLVSVFAFAATTDLFKDGTFPNGGKINSVNTEVKDGVIQGPGNWTQLNLGDYPVDAPYLHIIVACTGDTSKAQIVISDSYTVNLVSDMGITLTPEFQDVVLPVQEKGITSLSWCNFMGLDGGSSVYSIKSIFLSDSKEPTITAAAPAASDATATPKTGSSSTMAIVLLVLMIGSAVVYFVSRKQVRA